MRAILVFAILLLGLAGAAPEPKYSLRGDLHPGRDALNSLVEIEPSSHTHRDDRLSLAALGHARCVSKFLGWKIATFRCALSR